MPELPSASNSPDVAPDIDIALHPLPGGADPPQRFQFSISQLIVLTTLVAVFCAAAISVPGWLSMILAGCVLAMLPMGCTVGIVYGQGYQRTFFIGALFPSGIVGGQGLGMFGMLSYAGMQAFEGEGHFLAWGFILAVCVVSAVFGLIAMWLRRMIESSHRRSQTDDVPPSPSSQSPFQDV